MRGSPTLATSVVRIVFLARLREALGVSDERYAIDGDTSVGALRAALCARGGAWAVELAPGRAVRIAVNHALVRDDARIAPGDEVAFLPPVTGG
ncbi:MAG: molybdopterin converting factor subunit 1 [Betaproteobacteria bacterium]